MKQNLILLTVLLTALSAFPAEYYVDASRPDDSGVSTNWATAKKTIQAAVNLAVNGDSVWVTNGVYDTGGAVTPGYSLTNRVCITNAITVQSMNGPAVTVIKGAAGLNGGQDTNSVRGVLMHKGMLSGFTVTNGYTKPTGNSRDCSGGGIWLTTNCVVSNCVISGNTASYLGGGGVHLYYGGTLNNCVLTGNKLTFFSSDGGGANLYRGGTLNNCTLSGNSASDDGGGAYLDNGGTLNNCIVWGNTSASVGNDVYQTGNNNVIRSTCASDGIIHGTGDCFTNNPLFADIANGNFQLQMESPCINVGNNTYAPAGVDLAGNPRITGGKVDMGAYEVSSALPAYSITTIAGTNGLITPENPTVFQGYNRTLYITPVSAGYHIDSMTVDGVSVPPISSYTFTNVQSPHTITATFVANPQTVYVDAARPDDSGDGTSWGAAKKTIQAAVSAVANSGTVWVTNGIYNTGGAVTPGYLLTNRVCITRAVTIRSVNGPAVTVIKGAPGSNGGIDMDSIRGVFMDTGCALVGFTITDGYTMNSGNDFIDRSGGGVWLTTGCTVSNCVLKGNSGRGAYLYYGGTLNNCTLRENFAGGAGLYWGGTLNNCTLNANSGRGAYLDHGGVLSNCTITGNTDGGAYLYYGGTLSGCLLSGNSTESYGGGAYLYYGGTLNNCTLSGNSAGIYGGGATLWEKGVLNNCIVWNNTAPAPWHEITRVLEVRGDYIVRYTCAAWGVTHGVDGCITNNPLFVSGSNSNFNLQAGSSCINAGTNAYVAGAVDLAGNPRIIGGTVDMGVYETPALPSSLITTSAEDNGVITPNNPLVFQGYDQPFSIYPAVGCYIDTLKVDGVSVPVSSTYTFTNVQSAHTIAAIFGANLYTLTVHDGLGGGIYTNGKVVPVSVNAISGGQTFFRWTTYPDIYTNLLENIAAASTTFTMPATNVTLTANYRISAAYVDASRPDDSGDGATWITAKKTIQSAADRVELNGTVWVTNGIYSLGGAVTPRNLLMNRVYMANGITVRSMNGPEETMIKGASNVRGVFMEAGCTLVGFTVTGGETLPSPNTDQYYDQCGGGIWMTTNCEVSQCTINNNMAHNRGGGVYMSGGGVLNNCLISRNVSDYFGGGAYLNGGGYLSNSTVSENRAQYGGGVSGGAVRNCIVWSNSASQWHNDIDNSGSDRTCASDGLTLGVNGCTTNNPLFVDGVNSNFQLQVASPCIDAGTNSYAPAGTDLAGNPRIIGGTVDMGAYEFYGAQDDYDGDGLPNEWEACYFGNITQASANTVCSNSINTILQAYIAGLNPNDPQSKFQTSVFCSPPSESVLRWNATSGRVYSVYYSTNLLNGFQLFETNITAGVYTDLVHSAGQGFYRIDVRKP